MRQTLPGIPWRGAKSSSKGDTPWPFIGKWGGVEDRKTRRRASSGCPPPPVQGSLLHFWYYAGWSLIMGAALSVGIDIDPQALSAAQQNISLNEIDPVKMQLYLAPGKELIAYQPHNRELDARKEKFDIIIANILLNPLLELAEELISYGKPGAIVGVSGVISEQIPEVVERYSEYLESICISEMDGWACLSGTKRRNL
ncbi:hypothetical protein Taro_025584 [Colocasia esculenta]|uniref:ETFB lysine methyltransferase n=1 Tax=Colocasia esculenta TaxID=4460 RepID=A0A843VNR0_COLES|nr:hypothetical protein [Colocasia esculenta]